MPAPIPAQAGADVLSTIMTTAANGVDYIAVPRPGTLLAVQYVNGAATATATLTLTLAYADPGSTTFNNITSGVVTIASGVAAGTVTTNTVSPTSIQDGGCIRITRSGGATGGANFNVQCLIGP